MAVSLVTLGPGGVYSTQYIPRGSRLLALETADKDSQQSTENGFDRYDRSDSSYGFAKHQSASASVDQPLKFGPRTLLDRILRIDRVTISQEAAEFSAAVDTTTSKPISMGVVAIHQIARSWLSGQLVVLEQLHILFDRLQPQSALSGVGANALPASTFDALQHFAAVDAEENYNEPNPQAIEDSSTNKRLSTRSRLFADDAGAGKRTVRQQSYRFRARRSAYKKGSFAARSQQGSLFVHL